MKCPICKQDMKQVAENHYHCDCSVCLCHGKQYNWFQRKEQLHCPDYWNREFWLKTGNLA
jgi:hypothetical protein